MKETFLENRHWLKSRSCLFRRISTKSLLRAVCRSFHRPDTLDEAYVEFGELATYFSTIVDEETQQKFWQMPLLRHLIGILKAVYALLQLTSIRLRNKQDWKRRFYVMLIWKSTIIDDDYEYTNIVDTSPQELNPEDVEQAI